MISFNGKNIVVLSDTHGTHRRFPYQAADIAIHLGDACSDSNEAQMRDFFQWFAAYPAKEKIFIAGNHEWLYELEPDSFLKMIPANIRFLENRGCQIDGITFLSVAARPWLHTMPVINLPPKNTVDFLLTHGPAKGILDKNLGCPILKKFVSKLKPSFHLFGHIHECGQQSIVKDGTTFMNAANFDLLFHRQNNSSLVFINLKSNNDTYCRLVNLFLMKILLWLFMIKYCNCISFLKN